jgi:hypothetical protein
MDSQLTRRETSSTSLGTYNSDVYCQCGRALEQS